MSKAKYSKHGGIPDQVYKVIKLNRPEWYDRDDFIEWLDKGADAGKGEPRIATWHHGGKPDEYSDIFMTWDQGSGSDQGSIWDIPDDIWAEVGEAVKAEGLDFAVIWLTNLR